MAQTCAPLKPLPPSLRPCAVCGGGHALGGPGAERHGLVRAGLVHLTDGVRRVRSSGPASGLAQRLYAALLRVLWKWGSDADADLAEKRFQKRLSDHRSGHRAPPAKWRVPGSCLAEALEL
jgi:hypothetical protein